MKLYSPKTIKDIKENYNFRLSKSLGQNFLTDKNIIDKIVEATDPTEDDLVIEIGPGIGVITAEVAESAGKVVAIEIDDNLIPILEDTLGGFDNVRIVHKDVLKTDINQIIEEEGYKTAKVIGNLPYYITTPIIMYLLESGADVESITIMMQKEVADRIKSDPGTKVYGALSVVVQYYCTVETVAHVPKEVFVPAPKVDSTVLKLNLRKEKPVELTDESMFFRVIKAGFGQRRKTLLNSLCSVSDRLTKDDIRECLSSCNIDEKRRAETLNIDEFGKIANALTETLKG